MLRTYNRNRRYPFRACNAACADGLREDRRSGVIHGSFADETGALYMNAETMSMAENICAYCLAEDER